MSWITLLRQDCRVNSAAPAWTLHRDSSPYIGCLQSPAAHMLGTQGPSGSTGPGYSVLRWGGGGGGSGGEKSALRRILLPLDLRPTQGTVTTSVLHVKGTEQNERGQRQPETRVTGGGVQPCKLSGRPGGGSRRRPGEGGRPGHSLDLGL